MYMALVHNQNFKLLQCFQEGFCFLIYLWQMCSYMNMHSGIFGDKIRISHPRSYSCKQTIEGPGTKTGVLWMNSASFHYRPVSPVTFFSSLLFIECVILFIVYTILTIHRSIFSSVLINSLSSGTISTVSFFFF